MEGGGERGGRGRGSEVVLQSYSFFRLFVIGPANERGIRPIRWKMENKLDFFGGWSFLSSFLVQFALLKVLQDGVICFVFFFLFGGWCCC